MCFSCELDDMFSAFNTAPKAAWLKLTQLESASDRKDSQIAASMSQKLKHVY